MPASVYDHLAKGTSTFAIAMAKNVKKAKPVKRERAAKPARKKAKVFDAWHLYGSVPGMDEWAISELKKMRGG